MIAPKDLSTLLPASEALKSAKESVDSRLECAVARAINYAANTSDDGNIVVDWNQPLTDTLITKLESLSYTVKHKLDAYGNQIQNFYVISAYSGDVHES